MINEFVCFMIDLIPQVDAAVVWGKIEMFIDKKDYLELLVKYYDEDGYLINTMVLSDIRQMGDRVIPARLEMIPADHPQQKTVIQYHHIEFDIPLQENFFSLQNMKRVR